MTSVRTFMILFLTFKELTYLELILRYSVTHGYNFFIGFGG